VNEPEVASGLDLLWKTALNAVVGYGYRTECVVLWIVFFVGLGVFVLKVSGEGRRLRMPYGVAYSFDMLLPVIRLRDKHYCDAFDLHGLPRYYFYCHKIMGWLLAAFLATGVAALTKVAPRPSPLGRRGCERSERVRVKTKNAEAALAVARRIC
jgi:hypothetical protein